MRPKRRAEVCSASDRAANGRLNRTAMKPDLRVPSQVGEKVHDPRLGAGGARPEAHAVRGHARRIGSGAGGARQGRSADRAQRAAVSRLTVESAVTVTGTVVADERVKLGGLELQPGGARGRLAGRARGADRGGLGSGQADRLALPRPAPPRPAADLRGADDGRARDARLLAANSSFIEIHTPKLMGSASESGAELFKVEYFDDQAYLGAVAAVLQADGDGGGLRQGVRGRPGVPREPRRSPPATTRSSRASTSRSPGSTPTRT